MADMNILGRLLREESARQTAEQTRVPAAGQAGPVWTHMDTGATRPPPAAATRYGTPGQGFAPHGGPVVQPWGVGHVGSMMPSPGAPDHYGTPGPGQQWNYAPNYQIPPGYHPQQYQYPPGYFPGPFQPPPEVGGLGPTPYGVPSAGRPLLEVVGAGFPHGPTTGGSTNT